MNHFYAAFIVFFFIIWKLQSPFIAVAWPLYSEFLHKTDLQIQSDSEVSKLPNFFISGWTNLLMKSCS